MPNRQYSYQYETSPRKIKPDYNKPKKNAPQYNKSISKDKEEQNTGWIWKIKEKYHYKEQRNFMMK